MTSRSSGLFLISLLRVTTYRLTTMFALSKSRFINQWSTVSCCYRHLNMNLFVFLTSIWAHSSSLPFYPCCFLTGNPARRCAVSPGGLRSLLLDHGGLSQLGRSFAFSCTYHTKTHSSLPYIRDVGNRHRKEKKSSLAEMLWYNIKRRCFSTEENTICT